MKPEAIPAAFDVGDGVFVLYWRPDVMPDGKDRGAWDFASARVISAGRRVCVELENPSAPVPSVDGWDRRGTALRVVGPESLFRSREEAVEASRTMTPPAAV